MGKNKFKSKFHPGRDIASQQVDQGCLEFLENERSEGRVVRNKDLKGKAREIAGALRIEDFNASNGWMARWKVRNRISMRRGTQFTQRIPSDFEELLYNFRACI